MKRLAASLAIILLPIAAAAQTVIAVDEFNGDHGRWIAAAPDAGATTYADGVIILEGGAGTGPYTVHPRRESPRDVVIWIEIAHLGGTEDNWQFVECRSDLETGAFASFGVSADGFIELVIWANGQAAARHGPMQSPAIRRGVGAVNQVRASCIGDTYTLDVNDERVATVTSDQLGPGRVGFGVEALDGQTTRVSFDNIVIARP